METRERPRAWQASLDQSLVHEPDLDESQAFWLRALLHYFPRIYAACVTWDARAGHDPTHPKMDDEGEEEEEEEEDTDVNVRVLTRATLDAGFLRDLPLRVLRAFADAVPPPRDRANGFAERLELLAQTMWMAHVQFEPVRAELRRFELYPASTETWSVVAHALLASVWRRQENQGLRKAASLSDEELRHVDASIQIVLTERESQGLLDARTKRVFAAMQRIGAKVLWPPPPQEPMATIYPRLYGATSSGTLALGIALLYASPWSSADLVQADVDAARGRVKEVALTKPWETLASYLYVLDRFAALSPPTEDDAGAVQRQRVAAFVVALCLQAGDEAIADWRAWFQLGTDQAQTLQTCVAEQLAPWFEREQLPLHARADPRGAEVPFAFLAEALPESVVRVADGALAAWLVVLAARHWPDAQLPRWAEVLPEALRNAPLAEHLLHTAARNGQEADGTGYLASAAAIALLGATTAPLVTYPTEFRTLKRTFGTLERDAVRALRQREPDAALGERIQAELALGDDAAMRQDQRAREVTRKLLVVWEPREAGGRAGWRLAAAKVAAEPALVDPGAEGGAYRNRPPDEQEEPADEDPQEEPGPEGWRLRAAGGAELGDAAELAAQHKALLEVLRRIAEANEEEEGERAERKEEGYARKPRKPRCPVALPRLNFGSDEALQSIDEEEEKGAVLFTDKLQLDVFAQRFGLVAQACAAAEHGCAALVGDLFSIFRVLVAAGTVGAGDANFEQRFSSGSLPWFVFDTLRANKFIVDDAMREQWSVLARTTNATFDADPGDRSRFMPRTWLPDLGALLACLKLFPELEVYLLDTAHKNNGPVTPVRVFSSVPEGEEEKVEEGKDESDARGRKRISVVLLRLQHGVWGLLTYECQHAWQGPLPPALAKALLRASPAVGKSSARFAIGPPPVASSSAWVHCDIGFSTRKFEDLFLAEFRANRRMFRPGRLRWLWDKLDKAQIAAYDRGVTLLHHMFLLQTQPDLDEEGNVVINTDIRAASQGGFLIGKARVRVFRSLTSDSDTSPFSLVGEIVGWSAVKALVAAFHSFRTSDTGGDKRTVDEQLAFWLPESLKPPNPSFGEEAHRLRVYVQAYGADAPIDAELRALPRKVLSQRVARMMYDVLLPRRLTTFRFLTRELCERSRANGRFTCGSADVWGRFDTTTALMTCVLWVALATREGGDVRFPTSAFGFVGQMSFVSQGQPEYAASTAQGLLEQPNADAPMDRWMVVTIRHANKTASRVFLLLRCEPGAGADAVLEYYDVERGADNLAATLKCLRACHDDENISGEQREWMDTWKFVDMLAGVQLSADLRTYFYSSLSPIFFGLIIAANNPALAVATPESRRRCLVRHLASLPLVHLEEDLFQWARGWAARFVAEAVSRCPP